jgi:hypothetical protein
MSTCDFKEACSTYKTLREKGYPEKATLKLVGDRHRLSRVQRNCLFRGVIAEEIALRRRAKLVSGASVSGQLVAVDWYNVLITVESYLRGETLYLADDGVVRDASATHGSYRAGALTPRAMEEILAMMKRLSPRRAELYLDRPIPFSARMAEEVRVRLSVLSLDAEVTLAQSADFPLKASTGIVASSDSAVLDGCGRAIDLAQAVLEDRFGFSPPAVHELFPGSLGSPPQ